MAAISENPGDSNECGPNKNPRDKSKKPQEQQVVAKTRNPLPDALLETLFALLSRWHYPKLSVVCPDYRRVIASPMLYAERLNIGNTEAILYALTRFLPFTTPSWYILNRTTKSFHLSPIKSLPDMHYGCAVVTIGVYMYVIGGSVGKCRTSSVLRIDCTTHNYEMLPSMRKVRSRPTAGVIDGKIYVIGGCEMDTSDDWAEVFDVKTQLWSPLPGPYVYASFPVTCAVMKDKIYALDYFTDCFSYEPKKDSWERLLDSPLTSLWRKCSCVVDDVLFTIDALTPRRYSILAFDPKENFWRTVTILGLFPMPHLIYYHARMANLGGNLVILASKASPYEILCIEIILERSENGEFSGTIVTVEPVLTSSVTPNIEHCGAVTV